jgi:hypothetical protein
MTLHRTTPGTAVSEFKLHVFELAYVLSLMRVESVVALPDGVLFPKDPKIRKKVLAEGEKRLIASGRAIPAKAHGQAAYNEDLLSMAAAVADPRFTILTRRQTVQGERTDATTFFNNVEVVEITQTDRQTFRLRRLPNATNAFQQIRKLLGVTPSPRHAGALVELRIKAFERVRRHIAAAEAAEAVAILVDAGLPLDAAGDLVAALETPQRKGVVSVLKHVAQKVVDVRVLGFYLGDGGTWLTSVVSESANRVRMEAVDVDGFICRLVDRVASVSA